MTDSDFEWFVIHCDYDDSHCLVRDDDVVCEPSVTVGDAVKFYYSCSNKRKLLDGVVKGRGVDYDEMNDLLNKLNKVTKPKRELSFHEDEPRRAVKKLKEIGFASLAGNSNSRSKGKVDKEKNKSSKNVIKCKKEKEVPKESLPKWSANMKSFEQKVKSHSLKDTISSEFSENLEFSKASNDGTSTAAPAESSLVSFGTEDLKGLTGKSKGSAIYTDSSDSDSSADAKKCDDNKSQSSSVSDISDLSCHVEENLTDHNDSSSSGDELEPECKALLLKLSKKSSAFDYKFLKNLAKGTKSESGVKPLSQSDCSSKAPNVPAEKKQKFSYLEKDKPCEVMGAAESRGELFPPKNLEGNMFNLKTVPKHDLSKDATSPLPKTSATTSSAPLPSTSSSTSNVPEKKKSSMPAIPPGPTFEGEFFNYKANDPNVVKVHDDYDVFINAKEFKNIRGTSKSATGFARALVRAVFTEAARNVCSVSGGAANAKGAGKNAKRPPLHRDGIDAIIDCVLARASKKGWEKPTKPSVKQAMNNLLCEKRPS